MQLLKRLKVIHFLSAFSLTIPSLSALSQTAYANDPPPPLFECIKSSETSPNPILRTNNPPHGKIEILEWINLDFQSDPPKPDDYTPDKRCEVVAKRFQDFYECGLLQNIVQGFQPLGKKSDPGYPAIFVQLEKNDPAERKNQLQCLAQASEPRTPTSFNPDLYLLFMLSKSDPRSVNQELCSVRGFLEDNAFLVDSWTASEKFINSQPTIPQPITIKTCLDNNFFLDQDTTQDITEEDK
jgi:hypothetical protein